jgi:hypothetical protein
MKIGKLFKVPVDSWYQPVLRNMSVGYSVECNLSVLPNSLLKYWVAQNQPAIEMSAQNGMSLLYYTPRHH